MQVQVVKWHPPPQGWIKCNTDVTSKGNPGKSSYGFCIRDYLGNLIYAESNYIGISTNMVAETKAAMEALKYCLNQGWDCIILETDSLTLVHIINKVWHIPWEIIELMDEINKITQTKQVQIKHTFREANQLTDYSKYCRTD